MDDKNNLKTNNIEKKEIKNNEFEIITDLENIKELQKRKTLGEEDILFNSTKNIKKDILLFKDEILKEIKILKSNIIDKVESGEKYMNDKIHKFNSQITGFELKILELSNLITTDKTIREKVEQIINFKEKAQETIMTDGIKIDNLEKDFYENIYRIDNILKDTVLNSKIIGGIARFHTFFDFMNCVVNDISQLNTFKDKTISDLNNNKTKLENYTHKSKLKIENVEKESKLYTDKNIKKLEIKIEDLFKEYNIRLNEIKLQNISFTENMKKITKDLLSQMDNVILIKNELYNKFKEQTVFIKKENSKILKNFEGYKEEFYNIKKKYIEICNHIKYNGDLKNIDFNLKSTKSAFKRRRKSINQYKKLDEVNILKINKIDFDKRNLDENKNDEIKKEKKMNLRATINFSLRKKSNIEDMTSENNNLNNKKIDNKKNKNILFKSVVPNKTLNNSNSSKSFKLNDHSIIKEEEEEENIENNFKRDKLSQSITNKFLKINKTENEDIELNKLKIHYQYYDDLIQNKKIINDENKTNDKDIKNKYKSYTPINNRIINKNRMDTLSSNNLNRISISIEGLNNLEIYTKSKKNDPVEKETIKNVKNVINKDKIVNKTNSGYPKIVTNNGERIIISTRPMNKSKNFISYTNPTILALNNCVRKLYGNKYEKKNSLKSKLIEDEDEKELSFRNKQNNLEINEYEKTMKNLKNNLIDEGINSAK